MTDFRQYFVEPSSKCPLKDHFDITTTYPTMSDPDDPKDVTLDYIVQVSGKYYKLFIKSSSTFDSL